MHESPFLKQNTWYCPNINQNSELQLGFGEGVPLYGTLNMLFGPFLDSSLKDGREYMEERCKLPQRGLGRNPNANDFSAFLNKIEAVGAI